MTLWRRGGNCAGGMDDDQGGRGSVEDGQREKKRLADRGECLSPPRDSIDISLSSHGPAGE